MATISPAVNAGPDISRPGQQLLPTYAVKLLKNLKIPFGTDRTMNGVDVDPTIPLLSHIVDCLGALRDVNKVYRAKGSIASRSVGARAMFGFTAELGNILLDSITFNPPAELLDAAVYYTTMGQSILTVFPEIATQVTKQSGKMLLHHTALKSSSAMATEALKMVLKANPSAAFSQDASGATALHWITNNPVVNSNLIMLLISANPRSPFTPDNEGFLPLHWAVNNSNSSNAGGVEAVATLLSVHAGAASTPCHRGTLPLHWCLTNTIQAKNTMKGGAGSDGSSSINLAVLHALLEVYPDAARTFDDDGFLPIHRLVDRGVTANVTQNNTNNPNNATTINPVCEALRWLLDIYPQALRCPNSDGCLPLHRAIDQDEPHIDMIKQIIAGHPGAVLQGDDEGYFPIHLALDRSVPNSNVCFTIFDAMATRGGSGNGIDTTVVTWMKNSNPNMNDVNGSAIAMAKHRTKDGLLPLHLALAASSPPMDVIQALVLLDPTAIESMALEAVPMNEAADPSTWQGAWKEKRWSPLSRAIERRLDPVVVLFKNALARLRSMPAQVHSEVQGDQPVKLSADQAELTNTTKSLYPQSQPPLHSQNTANTISNDRSPQQMYRAGSTLDASIDETDAFDDNRNRLPLQVNDRDRRGGGKDGHRSSSRSRRHGSRDRRSKSRGRDDYSDDEGDDIEAGNIKDRTDSNRDRDRRRSDNDKGGRHESRSRRDKEGGSSNRDRDKRGGDRDSSRRDRKGDGNVSPYEDGFDARGGNDDLAYVV